jgi:hypothetical protein
MSATHFTTEQVDRASDYVVRHGAENRAAPVHYTLVFAVAGLPAPFMEAFHFRCVERNGRGSGCRRALLAAAA